MKQLNKQVQTQTTVVGQLSNGSDRQTITQNVYIYTILDDNNQVQTVQFVGSDAASAQAVIDAATQAGDLIPTSKSALENYMKTQYEVWMRWNTTLVEAKTRGLAAGVITALTNKTNSCWNSYATTIVAWNSAT